MLPALEHVLVNRWQRGFPLAPRPFAAIAARAALAEEEVLERFRRLRDAGVIDRIGPVFRPNRVGASTLAAMAVPPERLEAVAALVSAQDGVNHNYQREHRCNLWFVATGISETEVQATLAFIEEQSALPVLRLPLLEEYHVDLGFDLDSGAAPRGKKVPGILSEEEIPTAFSGRLVAATAAGLPLVPRPYEAVAQALGVAEEDVLRGLDAMLGDGRIRRIGAVVRHRRLGYAANAMAVWDVPDERAGELGAALAHEPAVTLCYRRARALPDWPYNLYCMVHGRERARVEGEIQDLVGRHGLEPFPHAVLFSTRCFVQRAARYGG